MAGKVIQVKRGMKAQWDNWTGISKAGEAGLELDTMRIKYGDGVHAWGDLKYSDATIIVDDITHEITDANANEYRNKAASARYVKAVRDKAYEAFNAANEALGKVKS